MTDAEYAAIGAVNFSSLKYMDVSPLEYQWRLTHPEPRKPTFALGVAVHCAILEPEKFAQRYAVYDAVRNGGKWDTWQAEHPDVESLKSHEMTRVEACRIAVLGDGNEKNGHRVACDILSGGRREEVLTWTDAETGIKCKGRLDYIKPRCIADLKTMGKVPSQREFELSAAKYGYAGQIAFYHDGAIAEHRIPGDELPYMVVVQSKAPHDVAVFQLTEETLAIGRRLYKRLLRSLIMCTKANHWPGVAPDLQYLNLPAWASEGLAIDEEESF